MLDKVSVVADAVLGGSTPMLGGATSKGDVPIAGKVSTVSDFKLRGDSAVLGGDCRP